MMQPLPPIDSVNELGGQWRVAFPLVGGMAEGWRPLICMNEEEAEALFARATQADMPTGHIIEVGSGFGGTSFVLLAANAHRQRNEQLLCVDGFFAQGTEAPPLGGAVAAVMLWQTVLHWEHISLLADTEQNASRYIRPDCCRLCVIDGCHDWPVVKETAPCWINAVQPGGLVAIHDVGRIEVGDGPTRLWALIERGGYRIGNDKRLVPDEVVDTLAFARVVANE